ncbi:hypothetical protein E2C01_056397 [Portunus trituberculatus]|uniref:Uncharacterized protein n=1 Tax=Portunus trituberculatus TaxID=210409 RepID=A0A5B7GX94_PORTR|nr:hypothetical protein [Portunus trituberculatus]
MKWTGDSVTGSEGTAAEPHFAAPGRGLARSSSPAVLQDESPRFLKDLIVSLVLLFVMYGDYKDKKHIETDRQTDRQTDR